MVLQTISVDVDLSVPPWMTGFWACLSSGCCPLLAPSGIPSLTLLLSLQSRGMDLVEILSFLFQLSFSTLGRVSARVLLPVCC